MTPLSRSKRLKNPMTTNSLCYPGYQRFATAMFTSFATNRAGSRQAHQPKLLRLQLRLGRAAKAGAAFPSINVPGEAASKCTLGIHHRCIRREQRNMFAFPHAFAIMPETETLDRAPVVDWRIAALWHQAAGRRYRLRSKHAAATNQNACTAILYAWF